MGTIERSPLPVNYDEDDDDGREPISSPVTGGVDPDAETPLESAGLPPATLTASDLLRNLQEQATQLASAAQSPPMAMSTDPIQALVQMQQLHAQSQAQLAAFLAQQAVFQQHQSHARQPTGVSDVWKHVRTADVPLFTGRDDSRLPTVWLRAVASYATKKSLPASEWTALAVQRLDGRISTQWAGFTNHHTNQKGDDSLPWNEFRRFVIKKSLDPITKTRLEDQFIDRSHGLRQTGHIDRCVQAWEEWLAAMEACDELADVYTDAMILKQFLSCLKPKTKVSVLQVKPADIHAAMAAAQEWDPILFEAEKRPPPTSNPGQHGLRTPTMRSNNLRTLPTPRGPPGNPVLSSLQEALKAASDADLAALGFQRAAGRGFGGRGRGQPTGHGQPQGAASNDTVVWRGPYTASNPPPKLTDAWRRWCAENRACYGCRTPNADHSGRDCRIFPRGAQVNAVGDAANLIDLSDPLNP
jgi:hypothetical protein